MFLYSLSGSNTYTKCELLTCQLITFFKKWDLPLPLLPTIIPLWFFLCSVNWNKSKLTCVFNESIPKLFPCGSLTGFNKNGNPLEIVLEEFLYQTLTLIDQ